MMLAVLLVAASLALVLYWMLQRAYDRHGDDAQRMRAPDVHADRSVDRHPSE